MILGVLGLLAVRPDDAEHRADHGGRSRDREERDEHRGVDHGAVLRHLRRRRRRARRSRRTRQDRAWSASSSASSASLLVGLAPSGALATPLLMVGRICQGLSAACVMPASLALVKAYWDGAGRQRAVSLWSMGSWGGAGFAALFGGLGGGKHRLALDLLRLRRGLGDRHADGARHPGEQGRREVAYKLDVKGIATFMVAMVALQVLVDPGWDAGLDQPRVARPAGADARVRLPVLPRRVRQPRRVRRLPALQEQDVYRSDALEPAAQRRGGHHHRGHDAGAGRRRHERSGSRAAHARVRHRDRGVHQGRREAAPALRAAPADGLGLPDRAARRSCC